MNYCAKCGFKIDSGFKFCPNCGSKITSENDFLTNTENESANTIKCKNCGEKNSIENSTCFSCGVSLSGNKFKKQDSKSRETKKRGGKKYSIGYSDYDKKEIKEEKVFDNKKILMLSSAIVVVFIFALVASGVFDTGETQITTTVNNQEVNSSVNLANMEEINKLENQIASNPDDMESTLHLSHLLQDSGLYEKAITNYKKYLEKSPANADARVDMAICYYNLDDYSTAISEMETAIKYEPKHQIAYLNLGIVNLTAKNIDASKEWFRKTAELDPNTEAGKRAQELLSSH